MVEDKHCPITDVSIPGMGGLENSAGSSISATSAVFRYRYALYAREKGGGRQLARDLGSPGITINNVRLGRIDTDLLRDVQFSLTAANGADVERVGAVIPAQRYGSDDFAGPVAYC